MQIGFDLKGNVLLIDDRLTEVLETIDVKEAEILGIELRLAIISAVRMKDLNNKK